MSKDRLMYFACTGFWVAAFNLISGLPGWPGQLLNALFVGGCTIITIVYSIEVLLDLSGEGAKKNPSGFVIATVIMGCTSFWVYVAVRILDWINII